MHLNACIGKYKTSCCLSVLDKAAVHFKTGAQVTHPHNSTHRRLTYILAIIYSSNGVTPTKRGNTTWLVTSLGQWTFTRQAMDGKTVSICYIHRYFKINFISVKINVNIACVMRIVLKNKITHVGTRDESELGTRKKTCDCVNDE